MVKMKRKILIPVVCALLLLVLFVPVPGGAYDDGGTREYNALTYKIVHWKKICDIVDEGGEAPGIYEKVRFYFFGDKNKTIDELWELESARMKQTADDMSDIEYKEEWLDKSKASRVEDNYFGDIVITEIYSDCFFARTVVPLPYTIKINGILSDEWCVGDQVIAEHTNVYVDDKNKRIEADLVSVKTSDFVPDDFAAYKPVIYLYPEKETEASVKLELDGRLTCTYPKYNDVWSVTALPDGTLRDKSGKTYNYLYWEGDIKCNYDMSKGFCVKGEDTAEFLENALERLGLTRKEANEFIVFWLPMMQENPYNIISFQTECYADAAKLEVNPVPDTLIRVFMAWQASDTFVEMEEQVLSAPERTGFTVVEWGGTECK